MACLSKSLDRCEGFLWDLNIVGDLRVLTVGGLHLEPLFFEPPLVPLLFSHLNLLAINWYYIRILSNIARLAQALGVVDLLWMRAFEGQLCSALFMVAQITHALNDRLERNALLWRSAFHRCAHILLWPYTTSSSAWRSLATQNFCFPLKTWANKFSPPYYWYTRPVETNARAPAMVLEDLRIIENPDSKWVGRPFEYLVYSAKEGRRVLNCSKAELEDRREFYFNSWRGLARAGKSSR